MNPTITRQERLWQIFDAMDDARIAANSGHPCDCPFADEHLQKVWWRQYYRTIDSIAERLAARAVRGGRIAEAEQAADAREAQPSWLMRAVDWFFNSKGK